MLAEKLEIFKTTRQLVGLLLGYTKNINREVKYAEWSDARRLANEALDMVFVVNSEMDNMESARLCQIYLSKLYGVQNRIRLLAENGYLGIKFKTVVILKLEECSRQGIGWRNYYAKQARIKER